MEFAVKSITKGLAPAGGCTHLKTCINAIAQPTDKAVVRLDSGKNFRKNKPIKAEMRWPNITFLGCANGDCETA